MDSLRGNRSVNRAQRRGALSSNLKRQGSTAARVSLGGLTVFAGIGVCGLNPTPAAAIVAEFQVTSLADAGVGSLREALAEANLSGAPASITFDSTVTGTIELADQLYVRSSVDIQGPGKAALTISGMNNTRVLYVGDVDGLATVSISGLTIANGYSGSGYGGGIQSTESLYLDNVDVINSSSDALGGGIAAFGNEPGTLVDIRNSTISGNAGSFGGGAYVAGLSGGLTIVDSTITDNDATYSGGGIYLSRTTGPMVMTRADVTFNDANNGRGGGIAMPTLQGPGTITDSHIDDNNSSSYGGGLSISGVASTLSISGGSASRNISDFGGGGIRLDGIGAPVTLVDVDVIGNSARYDGGGISVGLVEDQFTIDRSHIERNETRNYSGGGLAIQLAQDDVDITNSFVLDNGARRDGGGILVDTVRADVSVTGSHIDRNTAGRDGGGLLARNVGPSGGSGYGEQPYLGITGSYILDNAAFGNGAGVSLISVNSPVTVTTTEISGNDAAQSGGGIDVRNLGSTFNSAPSGLADGPGDTYLTVTSSVISGNSSVLDGGGINLDTVYGPAIVDATVIATNNAGRDGGGLAARTVGRDAQVTNTDVFFASGDDALTIDGSKISTNTSQRNGGGVEIGRIFGSAQIVDTELSGNIASNAGGGFHHQGGTSGGGGGIFFNGPVPAPGGGELTIGNSTLNANRAAIGGGAAITHPEDADFNLINSTLTANDGTIRGGGLDIGPATVAPSLLSAAITHSTLSGNFARSGATEVSVDSIYITVDHSILDGTVSANSLDQGDLLLSRSLLTDSAGSSFNDVANNLLDVDAELESLANTGGLTKTMRPRNTSPALNAGDPLILGAPTFDQRGITRVIGRIDLGAVEVDSGVVEFDVDSTTMTAAEDSGIATLTLVRTGGSEGAVTVDVSSVDGTAVAPNDFAAFAQSVSWAHGDAAPKTVDVHVMLDGDHEDDETLEAEITAANQSLVGARDRSTMTVTNSNTAPTITDIANQQFTATTASAPLAFSVGDAEQSTRVLTVTATSSNQTVLPDSGLTIAGLGANRTIAVDPSLSGAGSATVTVRVSDGRLFSTDTFTVTVASLPAAPITPAPIDPGPVDPGPVTPGVDPVPVAPPATPTVIGAPDGRIVTADPTPTISGTGQPGATIAIVNGSTGETLCSAVVDPTGAWSCTLVTLPNGRYGVTVFQTFNDIPSAGKPLVITVGTDGGGKLPATGSDTFGLVWLAAGLAGVGSLMSGSARRKTRSTR
jgi:Calx-beta domain